MAATSGSLRTKLSLWFAIVFLTIDAGIVAAIAIVRQERIERDFENGIADQAATLIENYLVQAPPWTVDAPGSPDDLLDLVPQEASFSAVALRLTDGSILAEAGLTDSAELPFTDWEAVSAGPVRDVTTHLTAERSELALGVARRHLMVTVPFSSQGTRSLLFAQVVVPEEGVPSLGPYLDLVILGIPIGGPIALIAAWLIAGRVVAPIERLSRAAKEVSPESIGERIRVDTSDHEIAELQRELNEALTRLETGFRAQERFISDVSHELRTPLAVLLAEASLLRSPSAKDDRYRAFVDSTEEELRRLARLIEGFLRLTRVEMTREPLLMEAVPVNDLVLDATRHVTPYASRAGVHVVPRLAAPDEEGEGPVVRGDPELLRTMLENLMRNAVRFSPTGAPVQVGVEREDDHVLLVVRDHGPGIPPQNLERIFDRFVRLEQRGAREKGGAGIGLAIARNVAVLHRGDIRAANASSGGCIMTVRLPTGSHEEMPVTKQDKRTRKRRRASGT